jgi:hypothetical protein
MKRILFIAIAALNLSACFGYTAYSEHIGRDKYATPSARRANVTICNSIEELPVTTKKIVLDAWGEPDRTQILDDRETWFYDIKTKPVSKGLILWFVIPIPLFMQDGYSFVALEFQNDVVTNIETRSEAFTEFVCPSLKNAHSTEFVCRPISSPNYGGILPNFRHGTLISGERQCGEALKKKRIEEKPSQERPKLRPIEGGTTGYLYQITPNNRFHATAHGGA